VGRQSSMWSALRSELAEVLLPQRCVVCSGFGAALHQVCITALPRADGARCARCWAPLREHALVRDEVCERCLLEPPLIAARRAAFRFEGAARLAVLEAKFRGASALLPPLAFAAADVVHAAWEVGAVTWVPLHASRRRGRGFDQGETIAHSVAQALGLPVRSDLIRRARATSPQATLGRIERARNVEGAFAPRLNPGEKAPERVLLVDDVATTGATLAAAASALRAAGVTRIFALTLAIED
jgi:predicted amidophosphoribosyltransferase